LRAGLFDLSRIPNTTKRVRGFGQWEVDGEFEARETLWDEPGKLKLLGFVNHGKMGSYGDAIRLALATSTLPNTALVRRFASRPGVSINFEQAIYNNLGIFARASLNDGSEEAFEFSEINKSVSVGLSLKGSDWGRSQDTIGLAGVVNGLSNSARMYFADGGVGILIGDGQLPHYGTENILECYYDAQVTDWLAASADYQFISNPAYNPDRGPVSVLGARVYA
jgi:high affinity Mn2+ porin